MSEIVTYKSDSNAEAKARRALEPSMLARGQVLFVACLLVIIAAIALPVPESFFGLLDAGWILTVCLSAAILMLSMMAKNLAELAPLKIASLPKGKASRHSFPQMPVQQTASPTLPCCSKTITLCPQAASILAM